jgi:hypothetical protein
MKTKRKTQPQAETPRTNANAYLTYTEGNCGMGPKYADEVVDADFARELERELIQATACQPQPQPVKEKVNTKDKYGRQVTAWGRNGGYALHGTSVISSASDGLATIETKSSRGWSRSIRMDLTEDMANALILQLQEAVERLHTQE